MQRVAVRKGKGGRELSRGLVLILSLATVTRFGGQGKTSNQERKEYSHLQGTNQIALAGSFSGRRTFLKRHWKRTITFSQRSRKRVRVPTTPRMGKHLSERNF